MFYQCLVIVKELFICKMVLEEVLTMGMVNAVGCDWCVVLMSGEGLSHVIVMSPLLVNLSITYPIPIT